jgi:two-component system KDP operon response regulator KdpE
MTFIADMRAGPENVGVSVKGAADAAVLLVEPNANEARRLTAALANRGISVSRAETAAKGKQFARERRPEVLVLELTLPDADGLVLCADLRTQGSAPVPVVVYTHQGARERVLSLRLGADDAISKEADLDEVVARIEVALRRSRGTRGARDGGENSGALAGQAGDGSNGTGERDLAAERYQRMGDLVIDRLLGRVGMGGRTLYLSSTEYRLLSLFMSRPGEVLTRDELSGLLFGQRHVRGSRAIDMHVRRLRAKLDGLMGSVPALPSVRGVGYRLVPRAAHAGLHLTAA